MKKAILFLIVLIPQLVLAQKYSDTINARNYYIELTGKIKELEEKINTGNAALEKAETTLDISKEYSESADKLIDRYLLIFTLLVTLTALIIAIASYYGYNENRKFIDKRIAEILDQKEKDIIDLFKKHEKEKGLLNDSKILILNKEGTTIDNNFLMILKKFKNYPNKEDIKDIKTHKSEYDFSEFDAIIFDNTKSTKDDEKNWDFENDILDKQALVKIANSACEKKAAFIFFGNNDGRFVKEIPEYSYLINFSNSPATIFANLINLLDFRRLLFNK